MSSFSIHWDLWIGADMVKRFEYLWQDSDQYKRPTKMSAPAYIEHLMSWVQSSIDDEQIFPSRLGTKGILNSLQNSWLTVFCA